MRIQIDAARFLEADGAETFVQRTVGFAAWHYEPFVERVTVQVEPVWDGDEISHHRCTLSAETRDGDPVAAGATGEEAWEAVQEAANLLELALFRPPANPARPHRRHHGGRRKVAAVPRIAA